MDSKLKILSGLGCDVDGALDRMLDDEEFLLDCIYKVLEDDSFDNLALCIKNKDVNAAFEASHTLKGIAGNTGLTPIYEKIKPVTEVLRSGSLEGIDEEVAEILKLRDKFADSIK